MVCGDGPLLKIVSNVQVENVGHVTRFRHLETAHQLRLEVVDVI